MERTVQLKSVIISNGVDAVDGKGIELIDEAIEAGNAALEATNFHGR